MVVAQRLVGRSKEKRGMGLLSVVGNCYEMIAIAIFSVVINKILKVITEKS